MTTYAITVEPGDHYWDRRHSDRESPSADYFLYHLNQEGEIPIRNGDSVLGDTSSSIGSYHPGLSTLDSPPADPLAWDTAKSQIGTSDGDIFTIDPEIPIKFEASDFDWSGMTDYKDLFNGLGEKDPTATTFTSQIDGAKTIPETSPPPKMRSASRKPKNLQGRLPVPAEIRQARDSHNNVEKQYRTRLKYHFERLLSVLQDSMPKNEYRGKDGSIKDPHCFSRGEVLDAARRRILVLEEENKRLATQVELLSQGLMDT